MNPNHASPVSEKRVGQPRTVAMGVALLVVTVTLLALATNRLHPHALVGTRENIATKSDNCMGTLLPLNYAEAKAQVENYGCPGLYGFRTGAGSGNLYTVPFFCEVTPAQVKIAFGSHNFMQRAEVVIKSDNTLECMAFYSWLPQPVNSLGFACQSDLTGANNGIAMLRLASGSVETYPYPTTSDDWNKLVLQDLKCPGFILSSEDGTEELRIETPYTCGYNGGRYTAIAYTGMGLGKSVMVGTNFKSYNYLESCFLSYVDATNKTASFSKAALPGQTISVAELSQFGFTGLTKPFKCVVSAIQVLY